MTLTPANLPTQLPYETAGGDQVKVGGSVVGQRMQGQNVLDPSASIESPNFVAGSAGFQLKGDGTAEFSSVTVRGTIIGTFKTATSGQRIEILSSSPGSMDLYSGDGSETTPGSLGIFDGGSYVYTEMVNAKYGTVGDTPQRLKMYEPGTGGRAITVEAGKPSGGDRGWVYLQPSGTPEGKVMIREGGAAPVKNMGTTCAGATVVGTVTNNTAGPLPYIIASTESVTFDASGKASITLPTSGFDNGILAVTVSMIVGTNSVFVNVDSATTKSSLKLYAWDSATGAVYAGTKSVSYIAIGW